ncbi:hypothetical protein [Paraburkholderia hospita]|uniref:hypothetical protein n=1 Tax=Paraburkholderia hospita TaxID=169430 RepID=UPI000B344F3B|nr:hypothetical protein [Paraburkholderia hospita]OUL79149.1 hypothetical protein CA603_33755 [Paraburkholderia hospita]
MLAAAAVTLLIYAAFTVGLPGFALGATVLFVLATAGGVVMNLDYHWNRRALPKPLVFIHALVAVFGFVLLVTATWPVRG